MEPNPQDLINLPYAGMAEKELRKAGMWRVTDTDTERLEWVAENVVNMRRLPDSQKWRFARKNDDYDPDFFRQDIDDAATQMEATA